jgi:hypothetical protein
MNLVRVYSLAVWRTLIHGHSCHRSNSKVVCAGAQALKVPCYPYFSDRSSYQVALMPRKTLCTQKSQITLRFYNFPVAALPLIAPADLAAAHVFAPPLRWGGRHLWWSCVHFEALAPLSQASLECLQVSLEIRLDREEAAGGESRLEA